MQIRVQDGKLVTGHVGHGDIMKLLEMFSPIGGPKEDDQDIDWADDLKFFIDNDDRLLTNYIFPAVHKHEKYVDHPMAYKLYMQPIKECLKVYLNTFEVDNAKEKFTAEVIEEVAKQMASKQSKHIMDGDYKNQPRLNESSFTLDGAITNLLAVEDSIKQIYKDLIPMAQKWLDNVRKRDPDDPKRFEDLPSLANFKFLVGSRGKRWYDNFYWDKMQGDLYTLLRNLPNNINKEYLKDFLNISTSGDADLTSKRGGHLKWGTIEQYLPEILRGLGKNLKREDLYGFGKRWVEARDEFQRKLKEMETEAQIDQEARDRSNFGEPKSKGDKGGDAMLAAQQRRQADEVVNQIINRLPANVRGDVRNAIARSDNKLQALEKEIMRRGLKIESVISIIKNMISEAKKAQTATAPKPRNFVAKNAGSTTSGAGRHRNRKHEARSGQTKHRGKIGDSLELEVEEIIQESFRSKLAGLGAAAAMGLSGMAGAAEPTSGKIIADVTINGITQNYDLTHLGSEAAAKKFVTGVMQKQNIGPDEYQIEINSTDKTKTSQGTNSLDFPSPERKALMPRTSIQNLNPIDKIEFDRRMGRTNTGQGGRQ